MKFMTIANTEAKTIDSREVAVMIEMRHTDLLRKIDGYIEVISENAKLRSQDCVQKLIFIVLHNKHF